MKKFWVVINLVLLATAVGVFRVCAADRPASTLTKPQPAETAPGIQIGKGNLARVEALEKIEIAQARGERRERLERHPVVRRSIRGLERIKAELQSDAAHDFEGHRVQAIKSIDEAIGHLTQALQADRR